MNISFITLNISGSEAAQAAADRLRELLEDYGECDFQPCDAAQQVTAALNRAFSHAELITVGVEPTEYARIKLAVLRAMRIKTEINADVVDRLKAKPDLDGKVVAMHAALPVDATVFLSDNGFCSGFVIRSGRQFFLMLPLETNAAQAMMQNGAAPYFAENGIEKVERAEPEQPAEEPEAESAAELPQAALLRAMNKKVYFAASPELDRFRELYGKGNEDVFEFTDHAAQRNGESPKSYLADLSRDAIPPEEADDYGAAISNVFTGISQSGEQRFNIYIALSDGSSSRVIRVLSQQGETPDELVEASYGMLLDMIEDKCRDEQENKSNGSEGEPVRVEPETPAQRKTRKRGAVTAVIFTVLAVLIALAVLLFFQGVNNAKDGSTQAAQALAQREEETTELFLPEAEPEAEEGEAAS